MMCAQSLQNHFLVSLPCHTDRYFQRSITYIFRHDADGAAGIVVNKPMHKRFCDVFKDSNFKTEKKALTLRNKTMLLGGPLYENNGFILHDESYQGPSSLKINEEIFLTTEFEIFHAIAQGDGPTDYLIALGCAGWSSGQLESELAANVWLTIPAEKKTLFEEPYEPKFDSIISNLNFDLGSYAPHVGHS
tara:strand:- start:26227 stop:26796 length:570 start_codon:yes stop_codon:yes gene_type:complete